MHNMTAYCFLFLYLLQELQAAFPVQNYTAVVQSIETVDVQISETYQWKTGSWSACDTRTRCGEGHKTRRIWCMSSSSGFIVSNSNCNSNLRPSTVKHCLTVCDHHKYELRWRTSDWSPCITKTINHCSGKPVTGIANRTVECVLTSENVVVDNEACEYFWDKPESEMACSVDCPQSCVTAKKNITCRVQECSKIITQIEEVEDVIVAPNINGTKCSGLSTRPVCKKQPMKSCKKLIKGRKIYRKKITAWSPCISALTTSDELDTDHYIQIALRPVIGFSRRNITCIDEEGNEADRSFCLQGTTPPLLRQCVVSQNCKVSPWSEWHVEVEGCIATDGRIFPETRTWERKLIQLPVGTEAKPCPPLYEKRIITTDLRPCYKHQWYPLEWSDCQILLHGNHGEVNILKPTCGNGLQYRNLTCLRMKDMVPVDENLCRNPPPSVVRRCKVACQRDCQVSHWSKWSPCLTYNMSNLKELSKDGYRHRVRSVLISPSNGGKPCPHLEEVDSCGDPDFFGWQYGNWSECTTRKAEKCGPGKMTRDITCVRWNGRPMKDYYCDIHWPTDHLTETCRVPCPNDCVMSEWSNWSQCSQECWFTDDDFASMYRNRTVIAIAGEGGKECRKKRTDYDNCNAWSCDVYKWIASDWGSCSVYNASNNVIDRPCGAGIQKRKVLCLIGNNVTDNLELCNFMKKPDSERGCHIPCPVDCVVSNYSDWTPCNGSCESDSVQYRHRIILQSFRYGGKPCPPALVEARPCSDSMDPHCAEHSSKSLSETKTYRWDIGTWSECQLPFEKQACGMGFQIRNVSCKDAFGMDVEPHFCLPSNWTLPDGPIVDVPTALRSCEVFCSSNCVVSAWSTWSKCYYRYDAQRFRHRDLVGVGDGLSPEECMVKLDLLEESNCPMIPSNLTDPTRDLWMSCIVESENQTLITRNGQRVYHDCGEGYRYKFGIQLRSSIGIEPGLERDVCWVDCPIDCQMSSWSDWTECNVPCGQGFRERKRHVLVDGNEIGRPCPKTVNKTEVERDVCNIVCMDYYWLVGGWSDCYLKNVIGVWNNSECGTGTHYRPVRCFDKRIEKEVPESRCDPYLKPRPVESCRVYCPGECVVSEWSISRKCTEPCTSENFQELTRKVLRQPSSTAEPCPPLVEREPCVLNATCHHHDWVLGPWGSCVVPEGAYCGEGVQKRPLICLRSDGRQVDPMQCEKTHKSLSLQEPLSKPCYTDCPVDCVMSQWSSWDKSSCRPCGPRGVMTRKRHTLQPPSDAGQPCPAEFEQKKPCEFKPCYHWKHSKWSECDLEGASCGYGVRRRVVECIRFDHLKVDKAHCLVVNVTFNVKRWIDPAWLVAAQEESHEEKLCHVPCPGDCVMSQWSRWGHCQKNCKIGQQVGYQTSSRHVLFRGPQNSESCAKQLWRTKPCWSDDCDIFAWKLRNSSYICERKDGLVVRGGCSSKPQPCFESCEELGGFCDNGTCYCESEKDEKIILGPTSNRCVKRGPRPPANHSAPTPEIKLKYYPDDSKVSFWMYAMISVGTAFIIFVAVTVYLMCRSSLRQRTVSVERQPSVRRRLTGAVNDQSKPTLESSPDVRPKFNVSNETYYAA